MFRPRFPALDVAVSEGLLSFSHLVSPCGVREIVPFFHWEKVPDLVTEDDLCWGKFSSWIWRIAMCEHRSLEFIGVEASIGVDVARDQALH